MNRVGTVLLHRGLDVNRCHLRKRLDRLGQTWIDASPEVSYQHRQRDIGRWEERIACVVCVNRDLSFFATS